MSMYNWSVDESELKKFPERYQIWRLEQLINFGLGQEQLDRQLLIKYLDRLEIDEDKRAYLKFLLRS